MNSLQERQEYFKNRFDERKESSGDDTKAYKLEFEADSPAVLVYVDNVREPLVARIKFNAKTSVEYDGITGGMEVKVTSFKITEIELSNEYVQALVPSKDVDKIRKSLFSNQKFIKEAKSLIGGFQSLR
jgi:hypothetical protein